MPRRVRARFQDTTWKHVVLFLLTLATTTFAGANYYLSFAGGIPVALRWSDYWHGLWFSGPVLLILGAHEMGHYVACRRYDVDASLPFFIPAPLPLTGTLGAVIRIREAFPTRTILFDIGVWGPIAGFLVLLPVLFCGVALSQIVDAGRFSGGGIEFGDTLLSKAVQYLVLGPIPAGRTVNAHPMVFAAWFGMFATSLNLLPFGQLDGGHISYATLDQKSTMVSMVTVASALIMCFVSSGWWAMTFIMVMMLVTLGPRHPRVLNEYEPLGRGRTYVALFAILMLIVCFTPIPIRFFGPR